MISPFSIRIAPIAHALVEEKFAVSKSMTSTRFAMDQEYHSSAILAMGSDRKALLSINIRQIQSIEKVIVLGMRITFQSRRITDPMVIQTRIDRCESDIP